MNKAIVNSDNVTEDIAGITAGTGDSYDTVLDIFTNPTVSEEITD